MTHLILPLASLVATVVTSRILNLDPGGLAFVLKEDEFDNHLDGWLAQETYSSEVEENPEREGCTFKINGDLGQPQPVYLHKDHYLIPTDNTGTIHIKTGDNITMACTGPGQLILHPKMLKSVDTATATCVHNNLVNGNGWLNGNVPFGQLACSAHSLHEARTTDATCYNNNNVISIGFVVNNVFYPTLLSCFDQKRLEVLYVWYEQNASNAVHQTGVFAPSFLGGSYFTGISINTVYSQESQKLAIAKLVGNELADKYITSTQYLARGHLAAKTDFIYATVQRASFYYINAAPQWQPFNAGNWNWLEQNLRARIAAAGYNTMIFTGTFGVSQLRDQNNKLVDIYLYRDSNGTLQIPVPLYYYKVVYDAGHRIGTAFVSINNPYYTEVEVRALTFCTDRCRNNNEFNWLQWQPDRIDIGYSFCCTVDEFRETVPHLPDITVNDLLT